MQRSNLATFSSNDFNLLRPEIFCVEPATARNGSCAGPTVKLDRLNERSSSRQRAARAFLRPGRLDASGTVDTATVMD